MIPLIFIALFLWCLFGIFVVYGCGPSWFVINFLHNSKQGLGFGTKLPLLLELG